MSDDRLMDTEQLARYLGVHTSTVRRFVREEGLPHYRVGVNLRYQLPEVLAWFRERQVAA